MPIKTSSGKWKWGNVERSSKKELVQTVYGIWKKNGSKGSFSDFLKGTHESIVNEYAGNKYFVKVDPRVQKYGQDSGYETLRSDDGKILGFKNSRGDCVIRALALATGLSYLNVAKKLHIKLDDKGDVPKDYGGTKWATVFKFFHQTAPSSAILGMKQNLTVKEFARTISRHSKFKNTYFIVGCVDPTREYGHAVFVKNGRYYDSWDSGDWIVVDVFDATKERGINAQDYRNIVQIRRGTKKRYKKAADAKINESAEESYFVTDLDYNKHIKPVLDIFKTWPHVDVGNITKHDKDIKLKWFGLYTGHKLEDIVALVAIQTNFDDYTINIANICSNGHGNGKKLLDKIIDYYSKTDRKYLVWFADPNGGEKLKNYYRTNFPDAEETEEKNEWWQTSKFTLKLKESYEPPYTLDMIKQKYGDEVYRKLRDDPVHRFRAETGIEVIHKEPTKDEFERIVKNWDLMTPEQKKQSDEFSMKQFGNNNKNRIDLLRKEYDFEVGDKVKIRSGIRCRQSGHTGTIVRIDPPGIYDYDMHGWSSFIVKMDDPNLGTVGFQSGSIEKLDTVKEDKWSKNERYFYCDDCNKNMVKAPDDQYIMIDNDLWEYVCKHGGKKLVPDEDVLCRDCIEKRLGRRLTLKDLGDKINLPVNDEIKKMLKKKKNMKESIVSEGKHWPEDYVKTAFNTIKNSDLGKQSWYTDNHIKQDIKSIVDEFGPLSHKNSNLGYFATIIKWFIAYAGKDKNKYQEFIERKLDGIIKTLLWLSNNPAEESKLKEQIKTKWTFEDFEKYQKEVEDQISREQSDKLKNTKLEDKGYEIIKIDSYQELHEKFGGDKTGYKGDSKWCHTNGSSTYDFWTNGGKYNFFVLAKKGWEKIEPPNPADKTTKAYDEYGTSLIAILVDVASGKLLNATLRWNHVIEPSLERKGTSVDKAFLGWGDLAEVTGKDVEKEIKEQIRDKQEELQKEIDDANRQVNEYLESHKDKIKELDPETNFKIIKKFRDIVTEIKIPEGITSIGKETFKDCFDLTSVTIPNSVTSIGDYAFYNCSGPTSFTIPNSVTRIGEFAFSGCSGLTSISIPDSVTSIGNSAFSGCSGLTSITIPGSAKGIGNNAFSSCSELASVTISNGVTSIGDYAFYDCSGLTSVTIPGSVKNIGVYAFSECSKLTSLIIENGVKSIGGSVVNNCKRLKSIAIPDSVVKIGWAPFYKTTTKFNTIYCSKKIWNKFRDTFESIGHQVKRKDLKEMKKESVNETHQIHSYPSSLDSVIEKITSGEDAGYELDHAYFNKQYKFIWMRNSKGYFHIFKPVKFVKTPGITKPFGFKDLILKDNGMLEEVDRLRFVDGNEGLNYLKSKYNLKIKTIS